MFFPLMFAYVLSYCNCSRCRFGDVLATGCHFPWRERCFPSCPRVMSRPLFQSCSTVLQECFPRARVSHKSVPPKCPTKVFVGQTCFTRPSHMTVRYLATLSYKGPSQECLGTCNASKQSRAARKSSKEFSIRLESVPREWPSLSEQYASL